MLVRIDFIQEVRTTEYNLNRSNNKKDYWKKASQDCSTMEILVPSRKLTSSYSKEDSKNLGF